MLCSGLNKHHTFTVLLSKHIIFINMTNGYIMSILVLFITVMEILVQCNLSGRVMMELYTAYSTKTGYLFILDYLWCVY